MTAHFTRFRIVFAVGRTEREPYLEQFLAAAHERAAEFPFIRILVQVVHREELHHLHNHRLRSEEFHAEVESVGEEDLRVQSLQDGQTVRHGIDEQVDRQIIQDNLQRKCGLRDETALTPRTDQNQTDIAVLMRSRGQLSEVPEEEVCYLHTNLQFSAHFADASWQIFGFLC